MTDRLAERSRILGMVDQKRMSLREAAALLQLSYRHLRRRYQENGEQGLVHGLKGRTSNRRIAEGVRQNLMTYYRKYYRNCGPSYFAGKIANLGYAISRETLRRWLAQEGLYSGKRGYGTAFRKTNGKKDFGEIVWLYIDDYRLPGDQPGCCRLVNLLDQATGTRLSLLAKQEIQEAVVRLLRTWVEKYGIPESICCKKHFVYEKRTAVPPAPTGEFNLIKTGFCRVCVILGVEIIVVPAYEIKKKLVPGAEIYYKHFTKALRTAGAYELEQANRFLCNGFISKYNSMFSRPHTASQDAHVKLRPENDVERIFYPI
jgi:hypothetical protein